MNRSSTDRQDDDNIRESNKGPERNYRGSHPYQRIKLTREQIYKLLREETLSEYERWQGPVFTFYINPNLP